MVERNWKFCGESVNIIETQRGGAESVFICLGNWRTLRSGREIELGSIPVSASE
jgi:hypothetical protein